MINKGPLPKTSGQKGQLPKTSGPKSSHVLTGREFVIIPVTDTQIYAVSRNPVQKKANGKKDHVQKDPVDDQRGLSNQQQQQKKAI